MVYSCRFGKYPVLAIINHQKTREMNNETQTGKPTHEQWNEIMSGIKANIGQPFEIPAEFGEYFFEYFLECLPPVMFGHNYTLCSEPYDHDADDRPEYIGIYQSGSKWFGVITTAQKFRGLI